MPSHAFRTKCFGVRCVFASLFNASPKALNMIPDVMRESWPHAPPHHFTPRGTYMITAATLHRKPLFTSEPKLDLLRGHQFRVSKAVRAHCPSSGFFLESLPSDSQ